MSEILISIKIETLEEGGYLATSDDIQGLIAQGRTIAETIEIAQDVAKKIVESCIEHGDPDKAPFFDGERGHWEITQGTTIPNHPGTSISKGTLQAILKAAGLTVEEFSEL